MVQRAASRKKLAAKGQALADGSEPIPNLDYLKRAIRSVGRLDPAKRPALKAMIRKRARELGALNAPGVKGTWAFANDTSGLIELVGPKGFIHGWVYVGAGKLPKDHGLRPGDSIRASHSVFGHVEGRVTHITQRGDVVADIRHGGSVVTGRVFSPGSITAHKSGRPAGDVLRDPDAPVSARIRARREIMSDTSKSIEQRQAIIRRAENARDGRKVLANDDSEAIELATMTRMPRVRGAADVTVTRSGPGSISVTHKSTGMKLGTLDKGHAGWQATHRTGRKMEPAPSMAGSLNSLIGAHNKMAAGQSADMAGDGAGVDLATPAATSSDGPRVTAMGGAGKAKAPKPAAASMTAEVALVYKKLLAKGMKPAQAKALAKRAAAMHAKGAAKAA
jgi:hypothetical protein